MAKKRIINTHTAFRRCRMSSTMLIEYAASYIEIFVLFAFFDIFFERRCGKALHMILCVLCSFGIMFGVQFANTYAIFAFSTAVFWTAFSSVCLLLLYKVKIVQTFAVSMTWLVLIGVLDFFTVSLIELVFGPPGIMVKIASEYCIERTKFVILVKCMLILFYLAARIFVKNKLDFGTKTGLLVIGSSIIYFIGFNYLVSAAAAANVAEIRVAVMVGHSFMALFYACWIGLLFYFGKYRKSSYENTVIATRIDVLEEDNNQLGITYGALAKTTHDFKNHIRTMQALAKENSYGELEQYINELGDSITGVYGKTYTGVNFVDAIINCKMQAAAEQGIIMSVDAIYPHDASIKQTDVSAVLVNLLDNAIEACGRVDTEKSISLSISSINSMLVIKVKNSSLPINDLSTTKSDTVRHGYGIKIVKSIAEKYSGAFDTSYSDGVFYAKVLLNDILGTK